MNALPALTTIATDAIRRQFATTEPRGARPAARPHRRRPASGSRSPLLLERAARAVAPAGYRPAH